MVSGATYSPTIDSTPDEDVAKNGDLDIRDNTATTDLIIGVDGDGIATSSQDANADDRVLHILGATVKLDGLILTGGVTSNAGGGIALHGGDLTMKGIDVVGNSAVWGGGIDVESGTLKMNHSNISENTVAWNGEGICNWDEATMSIASSAISGNSGEDGGGGIISVENGVVTINVSKISNNTAGDHGGGLVNWGGTMTVTDSGVSENMAPWAGGLWNSGDLTIAASIITSNSATYGVGGIGNSGTLNIVGSTLLNNMSDGEGDAIFSNTDMVNATSITRIAFSRWGGAILPT